MSICSVFTDNTRYNTKLSKSYQKKEGYYSSAIDDAYNFYIRMGGHKVSPDEILQLVKNKDVVISRRTLNNYEKWGLIPAPIFRDSRTTDYPSDAYAYAYAA